MKKAFNGGGSALLGGLALVLFSFLSQTIQAGELQSIRDEVRSSTKRSSSKSDDDDDDCHRRRRRHRHHHHDDCYDDDDYYDGYDSDDPIGEFCATVGFLTVTSPFWGPRVALNDNGADGFFPDFPYQNGNHFMQIEQWDSRSRRFAGRVRLEYCGNFRELWRYGGQLQLETTGRLGIDTEAHRFEELLGDGQKDHLWLGDCNLTYRFAQSEKAAWRAGLGFNWLSDPVQTDYGFNFTYGFDLYPVRPWVFSTEFDIGTLGKSDLFRFRSTAGVMVHRTEAYVGYEYLNIANTTYNGLIAGIRIHF